MKLKCDNCICKTCLIAEINGGAPGCGDCYKCMNNNYEYLCHNCSDYYNTDEPRGLRLFYLARKIGEYSDESEELD